MFFWTRTWVSKTDLTRYLRCPYAFHLLDRGLVAFDETVTDQEFRRIREGVEFQAGVEARALPLSIKSSELRQVFAERSIRLFGVPDLTNRNLRIRGKPDAVDTAEGALIPVEVKSHKDPQRSDELELAFYWLLLEPFRTRKVSPRGYLLLRRNGVDEEVEVEIAPSRFEQVLTLLQDIRQARRNGVQPRICQCTVCSGIMREEIDRATRANKDLTRIWGVGRIFADHLESIGIGDYEELVTADSIGIVEKLRERKCYVSVSTVDRWKHHAKSYSTSNAVQFGAPLKLDGSFIALDLEYDHATLIWLVGLCVVGPSSAEYFALWADTSSQEEANLKRLAEISARNPSLPVVTWNGNGADIPQLRQALRRLELEEVFGGFETRHLDLFQLATKTVRFPIPQFALHEVARYFAIPKVSGIRDGNEALGLYREYQGSRDAKRRSTLRMNLVEYNRDDVEALVEVTKRLASGDLKAFDVSR